MFIPCWSVMPSTDSWVSGLWRLTSELNQPYEVEAGAEVVCLYTEIDAEDLPRSELWDALIAWGSMPELVFLNHLLNLEHPLLLEDGVGSQLILETDAFFFFFFFPLNKYYWVILKLFPGTAVAEAQPAQGWHEGRKYKGSGRIGSYLGFCYF